MGPPLYMRSVVDRNVVIWRIPIHLVRKTQFPIHLSTQYIQEPPRFTSLTNGYIHKVAWVR